MPTSQVQRPLGGAIPAPFRAHPGAEKRPRGRRWRRLPDPPQLVGQDRIRAASSWTDGRVVVLSTLVLAELPDRSGEGLQWHVSVSAPGRGGRPSRAQVARVLRALGLVGGVEEDNHHPGTARHFWRPVDPAHRVGCECKEEEATVVDPDGYAWQNPREPEACRGCEYQDLVGKPCPIHAAEARP